MRQLAMVEGASISRLGSQPLCFPNLTIKKGDRILLTGPSGCGKTTLLRMLAGLVAPNTGSAQILTDHVSYVFQEPRLIPRLSAVNNLKVTTGATSATIKEMMQRIGLGAVIERPAHALSGGEATRLNLLRALLAQSDLILIDEAGNGLDADSLSKAQDVAHECIEGRNPAIVEVAHHPQKPLLVGEGTQSISLNAPKSSHC
ncbi:ATP-binding cassette domain-containing protein [Pseudophaeobacter sp.]|uniref:ATP-binding cassette domain-containing protein n=1 Tax=Pseudophaeobacter sp. TaxID=1971739 RepID=UPI0040590A02